MRSARGASCFEYAIMLGIIGSVVIVMATFGFRKVELARTTQTGHAGGMCR